MTDLLNPIFTNEEAAIDHCEADRWPKGPVCPHCGSVSVRKMGGKTQAGMFLCNDCRDKFTVRTGTVFARSHIPLHKWLLAMHLIASSKKGISAHQLWRMLGFGSYRTAWFMAHRIREAMGDGNPAPMGSGGGIVEVDETYIGRKPGRKKARGTGHKMAVVSLVERNGEARSFRITDFDGKTLSDILDANVAREAHLRTDELPTYKQYGHHFASHETVNHSKEEYVRGEAHTNTIEGFFSVFKRGMKGVYQHCSEQHLQRYLNEFDFRYSNRAKLGIDDNTRANRILKGAEGKRLTYRPHAH